MRLDGLPDLPALSELPAEAPADLVLSQAPDDAASGDLFGLSWPVLALAGGGGLVAVAVLASGGSDSDDSGGAGNDGGNGGGNDNGTTPDTMPGPGGTDSNNPPVTTTLAMASLTVDEAAAATWDLSDWFGDPDTGDTLTYAVSGNPTWLVFDSAMGELTIEEDATDGDDVDSHTFTVTATDGDDETVVLTVTLSVETPNVAPTTTTDAPTAMAPLTVAEAAAETWDITDWFSDGDTLTYTATGLPDWLELDDKKGELTIAAMATDDADVASHTFTLTASDDDDESVELKVTLAVENVNEAPAVVTGTIAPPATVTAMEGGAAQAFTVSGWFTDPDGDTLTFALGKDGPTWATFDTRTGVLSLAFDETDDAHVGMHTLAITASDPGKLAVTHSVTVAVSNVAEDPTVAASAPAMLTAMEGSATATNWTVSTWFSDEDTALPSSPDALTYVATGLPDWLTFASGVLTIAARATDDAEIGTYVLAVTASDKADAMVAHTTTLAITDTENEPIVSAAMAAVLSNRIAPATGGMIELDLTGVFTDTDEAGELTFAISESIPGTGDTNIITAVLDGSMLTLTPGTGAASGFGQQETVTITATDSDDKQTVASFAVTTRANVLDVGELTPAHGFIIQGDAAGDQLGWSVSGAGDVNGDGLDDLIVGAYGGDDKTTDAGEAYIIYGKANPAAGAAGTQFGTSVGSRQVLDTTSLTLADGFIIQGDMEGDRLGDSVSGAGDINGDGLADLIVGARWGDDRGESAGEAYIVYGKAVADGTQFGTAMTTNSVTRQVLDTSSMAPADFFILLGDTASDRLGRSVSGAGDVNGDGIDDLIVGARYGDDGGDNAGEAYIIYGKPNPAAGDGTPGTQFGITGSGGRQILDTSMLAPAAGFIIQGDAGGDNLGDTVSGAGDINGDGLADLIVGAESGGDGGPGAGEAYIIYGKVGTAGTQFGTAVTDTDSGAMRQVLDTSMLAPAAGFILQGDAELDNLSASVSGAGDINGDGRDDLIVGARFGDDGGENAGEAYIIYGKAGDGTQFGTIETGGGTRRVLDTSMLAPAAGFILQGDAELDQLGYSVSGAGDINGDGLADLIAGAWLGDDGGEDAGEAYIIYGKAGVNGTQFGTKVGNRQVLDTTGLAPTDGFILQGDTGDDQLGWSVSGAGDVNGDGFDDLIVGAFKGDDGGEDAGEAYVVYGGTHLGEVVSHAQTLVGMAVPTLPGNPSPAQQETAARAAFLHGGAGDDRLEAHADTTVLYGGAGDDTLELVDWSFHRVDGGSGSDTLVFGMGVELDFTLAKVRGKVRGIETLSLSDGAVATLDLLSVYALVESRDNGGTLTDAGEVLLRLEGTSGMVVLSDLSDWTIEMNAEGMADLYTQASAKLLIDEGLAVA